MTRRLLWILSPCVLLSFSKCDGPTEPSGPYRLEIFQAFDGTSPEGYVFESQAYAINAAGVVVGMAEKAGFPFNGAAQWSTNGRPTGLVVNDRFLAIGRSINIVGQVVGRGRCRSGQAEPNYGCIWENGGLRQLPMLDHYDGLSDARSINNRGEIVGWAEGTSTFDHAVLWRDSIALDLGTLGGTQSQAFDIDESSRIVGWARLPNGLLHAFLWQDGAMIDLDTLPGESIAHAINDSGVVVGWVGDFDNKRAFVWFDGGMELLPGGSEVSEALGLNNRGEVVGTYVRSGTTGVDFRAALWKDGARYDLTDLIGNDNITLNFAYAINASGQIVGVGTHHDNNASQFGFRLTPR
jgi:probable HAF family extracellular repeat protein